MNNFELLIDRELLEKICVNNDLGIYNDEYVLRKKIYEALLLHSEYNKDLFSKLITTRFPSEPDYVHRYRLDNFSLITQTYLNKIITTLSKIPRSEDFVITYGKAEIKKFCENEIGYYRSLVRWFYNVGLKYLLIDPNCVFLILPKADNLNYPYIKIIASDQILIKESEYLLYRKNKDLLIYIDKKQALNIYIKKKEFVIESILEYEIDTLPFVTSGGILYNYQYDNLFDSFIAGCLPFWNQALIEYSDKTAAIKQHLYPEKWRYVVGNCNSCQGTGQIIFNKQTEMCAACKGSGDPPTGTFSEILIKQSSKNSIIENQIPVPPAGYIQKDTTILDYLDKDIRNNIYSGLAALNMEFLMETPSVESGVAKEMDRQELNAFIYQIASHVSINILKPCYKLFGKWIFYDMNYKEDWINTEVSIPIHYDITNENDIENRISKAKQSNISGYIIKKLEEKYIQKKFENFNEDKEYLLLINELDPLPAKSTDEKISIYNAGMTDKISVVASLNIEYIINNLYILPGFKTKSYTIQMEMVFDEAEKIIEEEEESKENTFGFKTNNKIENIDNNINNEDLLNNNDDTNILPDVDNMEL